MKNFSNKTLKFIGVFFALIVLLNKDILEVFFLLSGELKLPRLRARIKNKNIFI